MENITQNEFISILMRNSPQELNEYIEKHGKGPRVICPIELIPVENENQLKNIN